MKKTARKTSNVIGWRLVVGCCDWWTRGSCGRAVCVLCEGWQLCPCHRGLDIEVTTGLQYNISMAHQTLPLTLGALRCLVNTSLLHSCPSQPSYTSCPSCECEGHLHVFISHPVKRQTAVRDKFLCTMTTILLIPECESPCTREV
ncbi:uncharacterized protein LOC135094684 isoform X2 [Scylla paramamosain]|uniref:uncharacterized protein LOC135094684 isoform X2 n=1 Tax=Scylla paramamosain TaxID=85552 RepID=UPI003083B426